MQIVISKRAAKFLQSINDPEKSNVLDRIRILFEALSNKDILKLQQFDIKNLKGNWKGYQRMRLGNIRILFMIKADELIIEEINFRVNLY